MLQQQLNQAKNPIDQIIQSLSYWYNHLNVIGQGFVTLDYRKVLLDLKSMRLNNPDTELKTVLNYLNHSAQNGSLISLNILKALKGEGPMISRHDNNETMNKLMADLIALSDMLKQSIQPNSQFQNFAAHSPYSQQLKAFSKELLQILAKIPHQSWEPNAKYQLEEAIFNLKNNPESMRHFLEKNATLKNLYQSHMSLLNQTHRLWISQSSQKPLLFSKNPCKNVKEKTTELTVKTALKCH